MAPRVDVTGNGHLDKTRSGLTNQNQNSQNDGSDYKVEIVWKNVVIYIALHVGAAMGLVQCFTTAKWSTIVFAYILYQLGGIGITAGAHRMWCHRSYKANTPLKIILAIINSLAFQNSILEWSRDHRVHHKHSETDADPHNAKRGFFFAHIGWLLCKKHPDVKNKGKSIDISDLEADPIVQFQHKHYFACVAVCCFLIPTLIPYLFWGETLYNAFYICGMLKYVVTLHGIWLVNSAAHMWGRRPYDKSINPTENRLVSFFGTGEGFHNFHHTFAWDYAASELGWDLNAAKLFIDFFALFGWAYDLRVVSPDVLKQRKARTGDIKEFGPYGPYNPTEA